MGVPHLFHARIFSARYVSITYGWFNIFNIFTRVQRVLFFMTPSQKVYIKFLDFFGHDKNL